MLKVFECLHLLKETNCVRYFSWFFQAKGRLHRWDFESEDDWAKYNEQKEAMPKAAFQFGVKMQDGRKTRKQNKDQKLTNDLHKINRILDRNKKDKAGGGGYEEDRSGYDDDVHPGKRVRTWGFPYNVTDILELNLHFLFSAE